jgi:hypothetical protein
LALIAAVTVASLLFASSANAANEYEPNDSRDTAYGPLAGGTNYTATFETTNDVDWYVFYVKTYSQMDFSATMLTDGCGYSPPDLDLLDKDGKPVDSFEAGYINTTEHLLLTLSPGRYYIEIENYFCTQERYRFRIDPAAAITSSRECGEAIVAKDTIGPELAKTNRALAKRTETLEAETQDLEEAEKALRRLIRKQSMAHSHKLSVKKRYARRKLLAQRKVQLAKTEQARAMKPVAKLQAVASQQQQSVTGAEGQIATYC